MTSSTSLNLPSGWKSEDLAGTVDLRVVSRERGYISVAVGMLALMTAARTLAHWKHGWSDSAVAWLVLTLILVVFVLWCAFGDEVWKLQRNCILYQVGIGRWKHSRRYQNAELDIRLNFSTKFGIPYHRLYAVENGNHHLLIERRRPDLQQLAEFISRHTGWTIRSN